MTPLGALGRGLLAGVAGTAAMTAWQELLGRLRSHDSTTSGDGRPSEESHSWEGAPAPARVAKRLLEGPVPRRRTVSSVLALLLLASATLAASGCGREDQAERPQAEERASTEPGEKSDGQSTDRGGKPKKEGDAALARRPRGEEGLRVPATRARIAAKESTFGRVLFDANGQVVYVFERDRRNRSNCTSDDCVEAWPPVLTRQQPSAGAGVNARLLGTMRRSDGALQVTYNGRPLYFYEHEGPGEIKCHNVDLHGGLWWVVTPRGAPAE